MTTHDELCMMTPDAIVRLWQIKCDLVLAANPQLSPNEAAQRAAQTIIEQIDDAFRDFRDTINQAVAEGEEISDELDEIYRSLPAKRRAFYDALVKASGYRPGA